MLVPRKLLNVRIIEVIIKLRNIFLEIKDHKFRLSSNKTLFWENKSFLLLSDIHIGGKSSKITEELVTDFKAAVNEFQSKKIIILGDLFDANCLASEREIFKVFLKDLKANITLVLGNHDKLSVDEYYSCGIKSVKEELRLDMFLFTHKPVSTKLFNIHGHLHPGYFKRKLLKIDKLPCFTYGENSLCLPSFGGLTGKFIFKPDKNKKVYVIKNETVKLV